MIRLSPKFARELHGRVADVVIVSGRVVVIPHKARRFKSPLGARVVLRAHQLSHETHLVLMALSHAYALGQGEDWRASRLPLFAPVEAWRGGKGMCGSERGAAFCPCELYG